MKALSIVCSIITFIALMSVPLTSSPVWERNDLSLGALAEDGSLHLRYSLGTVGVSAELSFPVHLEHVVSETETGGYRAVTRWRVPQLETFAGPHGRGGVIWQEPGGRIHVFPRKSVMRKQPQQLQPGWTVVATGAAGDYRFLSDSGWEYVYRSGVVQELRSPSKRRWVFACEGSRIVEIRQDRVAHPLLRAQYDAKDGLVALQLGPLQHTFTFRNGQLESWQRGEDVSSVIRFEYEKRLLSQVRYPDGSEQSFRWEPRSAERVRSIGLQLPSSASKVLLTEADGSHYYYGSDRSGIHLIAIEADGLRRQLIYNPQDYSVTHIDADQAETIVVWDADRSQGAGKLKQVRAADGRILLQRRYDSKGRLIEEKRAGSAAQLFRYDSQGRISHIGRPGQTIWTYEYAGEQARAPSRLINALGDTVEFTYTSSGEIASIKDLDGGMHEFSYDPWGRVIQQRNPLGYVERYEYDAYGRLQARLAADGKRREFAFGAEGLLERVTQGTDTWEYRYDSLGRLIQVDLNEEQVQTAEHEWTGDGSRLVHTSGYQNLQYEVDAYGRLRLLRNALGEETTYHYSEDGRRTHIVSPGGRAVEMERDGAGNIVRVVDGDQPPLEMKYDAVGRLVKRQGGSGVVKLEYNREGQLSFVDYGDGQTIHYTYDAYHRLSSARTAEVVTEYAYDAMDQLIGVREILPDGTVQRLHISYTPSGRRSSVAILRENKSPHSLVSSTQQSVDSGFYVLQVVDWEYDLLGRLERVAVDGLVQVVYRYDVDTLLLEERLHRGGERVRYTYDTKNRLKSLSIDHEDHPVTKSIHYRWDHKGRLAERTFKGFSFTCSTKKHSLRCVMLKHEGQDGSSSLTQSFKYDTLGRLQQIDCAEAACMSEVYRYDSAGNVVTADYGGAVSTFIYDVRDRLLQKNSDGRSFTYEYDEADRMIAQQDSEGGSIRYHYGYGDRLIAMENGEQRIRFYYNGDGMLVGKQVEGEPFQAWQWDAMGLVAKGDELFVNESTSNGPSLLLSRTLGSEQLDVWLSDSLASTLTKLSGAGSDWLLGHSVLGNAKVDESLGSMLRFTGKPYDADLGAYVFPARNYRPDLLRWMSADPSGFPDGMNRHRYAPVPTMEIDPLGLAATYATMSAAGNWFWWQIEYQDYTWVSTSVSYTDGGGTTYSSSVGWEVGASSAQLAQHLGVAEEWIIGSSITKQYEWVDGTAVTGSTGTHAQNYIPYVPEGWVFDQWITQPENVLVNEHVGSWDYILDTWRYRQTDRDYVWSATYQIREL